MNDLQVRQKLPFANHHFEDVIIYGDKENKTCRESSIFIQLSETIAAKKKAPKSAKQLPVIKNCSCIPPSSKLF